MLQKRLAIILTLILLVTGLPLTALGETWVCPSCGAENTSNFCGNCGARRPDPAGTPDVQVTAPPEEPFPMTQATQTPAQGGSLFSWLFQQTEAPQVTPIPTETRPPVTATPVPATATPAAPQSEWLKNFSLMSGLGVVTVDFSAYAEEHPGNYYVYYAYDANDYYTWYTMDPGETSLSINVIPGEKIMIGVYCDAEGQGRPKFNENASRAVTMSETVPYTGNGFKETAAGAYVITDSETTEVKAFALSDYRDMPDKLYARFRWYFDVAAEQEVYVFGILRAPNGTLYYKNTSYTWAPDRSGAFFRFGLQASLFVLPFYCGEPRFFFFLLFHQSQFSSIH